MMPEQQLFVLHIVMGSGSKNGSRLPKTAPGAVSQREATWLPGNRQKTATGSHKWLGKPPLR